MAWHTRPGGIDGFPDGTAEDWAAEWFDPIDDTHLNYLKDNLEFMLDPPYIQDSTTAGTAFTNAGTTLFSGMTALLSGTFPATYSGGKLLLGASWWSTPPSTSAVTRAVLQLDGTYYVNYQGQLTTAGGGGTLSDSQSILMNMNGATNTLHGQMVFFILDGGVIAPGDFTWDLRLASNTGGNCRNVTIFMREM